ncbi:hypothetical protein O181_036120 [Austropuccinia psidii MF-1]|uniref:Condensin complex subunit 2 n=1 Tax=Austropuccinia psidii MF-1 TaxID=1389203 RepID=A0A9Q3HBV6_9BASI|nr:hypothetical protein [Austropuccinia psidii MF-1]
MPIKRTKSNRSKVLSENSNILSPSSSSSTDSNETRMNKRSKKLIKREDIDFSSSDDDSENLNQSNLKEGENLLINKKKHALSETSKRRLSGKFGMVRKSLNFEPPQPDFSSPARAPITGRVGALARARENQAKNRPSTGGAGENPLLISAEVMNNNYDEWMKMATDNKINVNNTWSFALIDYFHDMSLLRNPESEGGINFQKASCTLDGCVKIWTSRVDSVATETGKLLSGLAEEANNISNSIDDEDDEEQGDESSLKAPKKARTRTANSSSLVEFNDKIKVKELELEFTVDPLFKKTCADFDEGGSGGILMSHLAIDSSMTIIFDSSGKPFSLNSADDLQAEEEGQVLDISKLKSTFLNSAADFQACSICPCLSDFKFSTSDSIQAFIDLPSFANALEPPPVPSGDQGDQGDFFDSNPSPHIGGNSFEIPEPDEDDDDGVGMVDSFIPAGIPSEKDLVMALVDSESKRGDSVQGIFGNESTGMFDYFDKSLKKSWAGPEHWKLRRTVAFKSRDEETQTTMNRTKREKSVFSFDFLKPLETNRRSIFQTTSVGLTLPGYKPPKPKSQRRMIKKITGSKGAIGSKQMLEQHCLPDDMHFNASQLLRFDMKPKTTFNMRVKGPANVTQNAGAEIDENYWARTAAAAAQNSTTEDANADEASSSAIPFATQFFQDDADDMPDFEEEFDNPVGLSVTAEENGPKADDAQMKEADENDLIAATQNLNVRVRPEFVNYAKKAKRVDVKKLKENIWRELEHLTIELEAETQKKSPEENLETEKEIDKEISPANTFTKVISGLRSMYPKDKMEEISTSFCFICLLHLANEKGLRIQQTKKVTDNPEDNRESIENERSVGRLEELKIFKE